MLIGKLVDPVLKTFSYELLEELSLASKTFQWNRPLKAPKVDLSVNNKA